MLAVGSTLSVYPAASCVPIARAAGATIVIVNAEPTEMDHLADHLLAGPDRRDPAGHVGTEHRVRPAGIPDWVGRFLGRMATFRDLLSAAKATINRGLHRHRRRAHRRRLHGARRP